MYVAEVKIDPAEISARPVQLKDCGWQELLWFGTIWYSVIRRFIQSYQNGI